MMKLPDKLIGLRKEKGWSQEDFAEKLDVSRQAISRWENGTAFPDAQNLLRISKLFNVTADYLLNDDYENEADASTGENVAEETVPLIKKKKNPYWYLIPVACFVILAACIIVLMIGYKNASDKLKEVHLHQALSSVKENEIAPTCTSEGSYDEVIVCTDCGEEVLRTTKSIAKLAHTLSESVKENEIAPTCTSEGSYDEVIVCTDCSEEVLRTSKIVAKLAHTLSESVKENEIASTCTAEGSYDEVVYCSECDEVVLKTLRSLERLDHQFQNKKCLACGEAQPSEGLLYMSNGGGICFVSCGDCTDENIVIPAYSPSGEKVTQIKAYAFAGHKNVKSIRIPETVSAIGEGAFEDCINLESVSLPSKITIIQSYTFKGCEKLKEITIPSGVYKIGTEAFAECYACERILIPSSVTQIGKFAFRSFSRCEGSVTFGRYDGWKLYDDSGDFVNIVDFQNGIATPVLYLTFKYSEYIWKRG